MSEAQNGGKKMERLTNKAWRNLDPWECCGQDKYCQRGCHNPGGCTNGCIIPRLYARLGAYEDTERTPEEIDMDHEAAETLRHLCRDCDLDQLEELAEADKDGRLVVLPCKVGDTVYRVITFYGEKPVVLETPIRTEEQAVGIARYIGKQHNLVNVYLTREEAEAAWGL